jgi:type 1 glutamine amidotransferase
MYVSFMTRVLLVTKGHPFAKDPFFNIFDHLVNDPESCVTDYTHVEQPAAQHFFHPDLSNEWDVFVMYDMPGIEFNRSETGRGENPVTFVPPSDVFKSGVRSMLEKGKGLVFLHHALAGWPLWEEWARIIGGRFHYQPATLDGTSYPDSGYRHDVTHTVEVVDDTHPITMGIPTSFEFTDELYLAPIFEKNVQPIFRSHHEFASQNFYSADLAIRGQGFSNDGWEHPYTSNAVGWVKHAGNSPVAYLQFGDGPSQYAEPIFQKIIGNAISWASSNEAHNWAQHRRKELDSFC